MIYTEMYGFLITVLNVFKGSEEFKELKLDVNTIDKIIQFLCKELEKTNKAYVETKTKYGLWNI